MVFFLQLFYQSPVSTLRTSDPSISSSLTVSHEQYFLNTTNYEVPNSIMFSILPPFPPFQTQIQGGSSMTGTDLCVNKPHKSRSYLNHLVSSSALPTLKRPKPMPFTHVRPSSHPYKPDKIIVPYIVIFRFMEGK
jgi:hypothetical protein